MSVRRRQDEFEKITPSTLYRRWIVYFNILIR